MKQNTMKTDAFQVLGSVPSIDVISSSRPDFFLHARRHQLSLPKTMKPVIRTGLCTKAATAEMYFGNNQGTPGI